MNEDLLVNITPHETRVALIQLGAVQELHIERTASRGRAGNIYLGRVARVLPGMQSAFIDIGLERAAFLHVADIWEAKAATSSGNPAIPIEKLLFDGQSVLVQVIKDPIGTKGARLSTQISIAGRMLVYLPQDPHIGVSQRIESEADREQLRARLQQLLPDDEKGGFIIRTMAEEASEEEWTMDLSYLRKTWEHISQCAKSAPPPTLLHEDLSLSHRVLRD
jgi:ribonuclease G